MCLGVPGEILDRFERDALPMAHVDFGGVTKEICLAYTPEAAPGQYVLVHVGFAISVIDEAEAQETFRYLDELAEAADAEARGDP